MSPRRCDRRGRALPPEAQRHRARLAETLHGELNALTERIAALENSRKLLARILADVRAAAVGPGNPGDPGRATAHTSVRKAGPAVGVPARRSAGRPAVRPQAGAGRP